MAPKPLTKLVSIIIVTRNRQEEVLACLKSVFDNKYQPLEVIVVDNASDDDTVKEIKSKFPKVNLIKSDRNLGANGGKNLGQSLVKGEFIFFLDSDTIVDQQLLTEMVKIAETDQNIGMVCPKMYYFRTCEKSSSAYCEASSSAYCEASSSAYYEASSSAYFDKKDVIWYAGASVNLLTSQAKNFGCNEKDLGQHDQVRETFFAPTAYLVSKKAAEKLKGHGEMFFMGYVDSDYGYRTKEAGFKVVFCPKAFLWHRLNQEENVKSIRALGYNLPLRAYYFARNRVVFMKKHAPLLNFTVFMIFFFPLMTIYISYKSISFKGNLKFLKPHLEGSQY